MQRGPLGQHRFGLAGSCSGGGYNRPSPKGPVRPWIEPPGERGEFTAAVITFLDSGFLVYLVSGYVAARLAVYPGGLNGAMMAVLGATYALGVALPPMIFGSGVSAAVAGLVPFLVDFVGGKLGKSSVQT